MERPVMNPSFFDEAVPEPVKKRRRIRLDLVWKLLKLLVKLLLVDVLGRGKPRLRIEDGTPVQRFVRGVMYRAAFVPLVVAGVAIALVFAATHPPSVASGATPTSVGIWYDQVSFAAEDGQRLEGWLVPVLDARRVLEEREKAIKQKYPAVVLVHDVGRAPEQMLPLVRPLHEAGIVVLVVGLRGSAGTGETAITFGLKESQDVLAAVDMLRRRTFVDGEKVAAVGVGSGATAVVLAADRDATLKAVALANPVKSTEAVLQRLSPQSPALNWMEPLCKWTFELWHRVDVEDVDLARHEETLSARPTLMVEAQSDATGALSPEKVREILEFLGRELGVEAGI